MEKITSDLDKNDWKNSPVKTYVIRQGRMTASQKRAIEILGPSIMIPYREKPLSYEEIFGDRNPVIMEIGFGMGQASWQIALARQSYNYLGVEVHSPGVGRLLMDIESHGIKNLRIIQHDAVEVFGNMIAPGTLDGLHIFYPDPWPKKRHHKRRFMRAELIDLMVSRLKMGAYLYFVTDIEEYAENTKILLSENNMLVNQFDGYASRIEWRPETRFERKASEANRPAFELFFIKKP
jgi:tRNA (guanine-N7-)-methyltransferase